MKLKIATSLFLCTILLVPSLLRSQCTPDPSYTMGGIYPVKGSPIHPAAATGAYNLTVTVVVPYDTVISPFPRLPIDSGTLKEFIGFPSGFNYAYNTANRWVPGDSSGCIVISGTPGVADIGTHNISVVFTVVILGFAYTDTIENYWALEVKDASHVGIIDNSGSGDLKVYPNPASEFLWIESAEEGLSLICLQNSLGSTVREITAETGRLNPVRLETAGLPAGQYFLTIRNGNTVVNRKVMLQ